MLKFLHIENIAVIEQTDIEFKEGFNVLTGETGAGKSILIDAINAVLGERTSKDLIRTGCDTAVVSAVFGDLDDETLKVLSDNNISPDEDGNIIINRKLSLSGKGLIKVNNIPVTATLLREIAKNLINIHGQHDNQALLNPEKHLGFIDAVANNGKLLEEYYSEFRLLNSIRKELLSLQMDEDEKSRKIDLLKYQINELETANIKIGELEDLKQKLNIANNFEKTYKALSAADYLLSGNDDNDGVLTQISNCIKYLSSLGNDFENSYSKLNEALNLLQDARAEISVFLGNSEFSELDPNEINQRLDFLSRLMVKYGSSEEEMLDFLENAKLELENISLSDKKIMELSSSLEESKLRLIEKAKKLTDSRLNAANKFSKDVCNTLEYLNMPNVKFLTDIKQGKYQKNGCDTAEFLISANDGESLKPLIKIASGGELSRVMLSIKSVLLDKDNIGTMIFDEIDTGISGFAAGKVATQLKNVAKARQVICVTHLAQIAALADEHLLIEKTTDDGHTFTNVTPLGYKDRISEIARIMSGTELTENLYNSAKELIDRSNIL
ncbi:MAG: DNA repair protein RecN [Clostridia bacterium]|nr:DNA repair protein RecN [Clostridia bacterium]